ncbi:MAG: hypothetical protein WC322_06000 [Candidatus Paceibacterota bacterium]|jgi:hypothetical protein
MPFVSQNVLDNGLNHIKNNCDKLALVSSYTNGESYATVAGKILAEVSMTSSDFTLGSSGNNRTLTSASGKQDASANASGGDVNSYLVFLNTTSSEVLWATDETSGQAVVAGNPVSFPSLVYTSMQPTAV